MSASVLQLIPGQWIAIKLGVVMAICEGTAVLGWFGVDFNNPNQLQTHRASMEAGCPRKMPNGYDYFHWETFLENMHKLL